MQIRQPARFITNIHKRHFWSLSWKGEKQALVLNKGPHWSNQESFMVLAILHLHYRSWGGCSWR
jgi:hypothetical protein